MRSYYFLNFDPFSDFFSNLFKLLKFIFVWIKYKIEMFGNLINLFVYKCFLNLKHILYFKLIIFLAVYFILLISGSIKSINRTKCFPFQRCCNSPNNQLVISVIAVLQSRFVQIRKYLK